MVHQLAQLVEGAVPHAGVDLRGDIGREVPQRGAGEQGAEVHRQQHLHRFPGGAAGDFLRLEVQNGLHHGGAQQLRDGDAEALGTAAELVRRDHHGDEILEAVRLRRAAEVVGGGLLAAGLHIPGIASEAVLHLLRRGFFQPTQHALLRRDDQPILLAQILRQQGFQKHQRPRAVGKGVEKLHGDAPVIHQHTEGALPHLMKRGVGQGAAFLRLDGRRFGYLLQVVPERAPAQPDGDGGEAAHRDIQGAAQHLGIHRLRQRGGQAEEVVPVPPLGGGVYFGRVVQTHPAQTAGRGEVLGQEAVDGRHVVLHILVETVQHIGVPALRRDAERALAAARHQLFLKRTGIVQQYLVPAGEQQGRRKAGEVAEQRRAQRVGGVGGVALGVELQQLLGEGRVVVPVRLVGLP